ncbi:PEP-CTERM sorting domain-containing protein [Aeoliella sp.]|uniref:PEP-CTERM sorting domain-containing protein n=1 Tax=Aeoliella sp. TaxID=2795800 RepID=UPI003CCBEF17
MRSAAAALVIGGLSLFCVAPTHAQIAWIGGTSSDAFDGTNWEGGVAPTVNDSILFRGDASTNHVVDLGSGDTEWGHMLFNHIGDGTTIDGTGTLTITVPDGGTSIGVKALESQGGDKSTIVNPNVVTDAVIEARNGHDLTFNGDVEAYTVHSYNTSNVTFNGALTIDGSGEPIFTGNHEGSSVVINGDFTLRRPFFTGSFGIRNGITLGIGPDATLRRIDGPAMTEVAGLDLVNLYNDSVIRLDGDDAIDGETDLWSRTGGGTPRNTLDLNGYSTIVEFLATVDGEAQQTFVVDFGEQNVPNTLLWAATHHMDGEYEIINFDIGQDTLMLGGNGSEHWTAIDPVAPELVEAKKSQITINGIPYAPADTVTTDPYWTVVDFDTSHAVEFFNVENPLLGDFNADGTVNIADYVVWRNNLGGPASALNGNGTGWSTIHPDHSKERLVTTADFELWKARFGDAIVPGVTANASVPEPGTAILSLALLAVGAAAFRRRRAHA